MVLSRASEPFARLPWRITAALIKGELTRDQYALLVYMVATISRQVRDGHPTNRVVTELDVTKAEMSWRLTTERIRQVMLEVAALGWITATSRQGSKKWVITLTGAKVVEDGEEPPRTGPRSWKRPPSTRLQQAGRIHAKRPARRQLNLQGQSSHKK